MRNPGHLSRKDLCPSFQQTASRAQLFRLPQLQRTTLHEGTPSQGPKWWSKRLTISVQHGGNSVGHICSELLQGVAQIFMYCGACTDKRSQNKRMDREKYIDLRDFSQDKWLKSLANTPGDCAKWLYVAS